MGQKIRKMLISEKGSITVLVVAAMLFMIVILALSFMGISNKTSTQMSNIKQIEAEYASEEDIGQVYKETIETIDRVGDIKITPSTTEWTNGDVTVTIEYQKQLTENRKAGIGSADTPNATSLTLTENGTVYAEAHTKDGHRRKASLQINNIDKVKPTAIIRTNGGSYVMPTIGDKATIKTRVSVSDLGGSELNDIKYAWSQSKDTEPTSWQTFADGDTVTKNDCTVGTYYLWLNVTDNAGNRADTKVSNAFIVRDSSNVMDNITFKVEPDGWTNEDVKVTVIYGDNLTENRKAGPEGGELKPNATVVTMTENGKVVAEAEDLAGNKVIAEIVIDKIDKVPPVIKTVTNPSNGNWTNQDVTITLVAEDNLSGIKEFQWFENGEWTTRALETSGNTGTITYTVERDTTIRFRVIDNAGNISEEKTTVIRIDKTAPTYTRAEVKNITTTGYDVYVYGVTDGTGSGVNRVQFPTWTNANGQDDIQSNWATNEIATGVKQADGTTWVYHVNVTDHKNEYGKYITHVYAYDNLGNRRVLTGFDDIQVPGVVITLNANGGSVSTGTLTKGYGSQMGTLPTPTRTGYTFTGWFTAATGGTKITNTTTVPANNVTYYAQWTINNYTVTYDNNYYANSIWNDTTVLGRYAQATTTPKSKTNVADANAKDGNYIKFVMPAGTSGGPYYSPAAKLTAGKTYTWSVYVKASTNKKLYMGDEQNGCKDVNVTTSWQKVTHTFTATDRDYKAFIFYANYGGWADGEELYVHSLEIMEGTPTHTTASKQYNSALGTLPAPTRTGYTFTGWYTAPVGGTKISDATTVPANNVTYYAHWTTNTYKITYNLNGGTANGPTSFNVGTETITLPTPTRTGYTFTGWTGSNGTTPQTTVTIPKGSTRDRSYTANWTATNYTISYNLNGGSISGQPTSYNVESNAITLPTPTRTGYTFTGWTGSNGTTPQTTVTIPKGSTGNKEYTANWSINSYYIDLNMNVDGTGHGSGYNSRVTVGFKVGGVDKGYIQDYYTQHTYGTSWEIYGLRLDGEAVAYTASGTLGAQNTGVYVNLNTVNFVSNNNNYGTVSVANRLVVRGTNYTTSGATVTLAGGRTVTAAVTNLAGYTTNFTGWTPTSGTVNAATTVTANFTRTANPYTVTYNYAENGGKSATKTSATVNYGSAIDLSPTAVKDGYTFVGWNTNKDATTKLNSLNMGAGNVTLYAIYSKTITGTFNYFNGTAATSTQVSQTIYNKTTQATIKTPVIANATKDSITYTQRGWSTSNAANAGISVNSGANATISANTTYYSSYQATITATFYYHGGTDQYAATQATTTASATRFMNYAGTYTQSNIAVPSAVSSSTGYYGTTYKGVSNARSSGSMMTPTTANTAYYAVYNVGISYYYYNGSQHTASTATRTATTNGTTYSCSVNTEPKPTAYDGANFKWWSYDANQAGADYKRTPTTTASTTLYAVYEKSVTATFYYHTGDNLTNTQATTTASGIRNYISKSGGINTYNGNISIPAAVTGSSTYYTTAYRGVATAVNSSTAVTPTTANTKYYAFYDCSLTYYYYNGSAHTSSTTTRRARSNGTNYVCTVDSVPTPSAYDGATFKWWSYDANQAGSDYQRAPNATGVQALYAMYQKNITATFNYYNGTAAAKATASATRSYISKSGGVNTIQANIGIPAAVSGSKGVDSTTYSHVSTSKTGSATTPTTATATYYAVYKKTVTATKYVYNNTSSTATGTAYAYYDGSKANASINLGTTTPPSGYTARGWSTSNAANATVNVALNGNASIMNNTTYYMSYSYSVTLTYNGNGATSGVPAAQSGTAYMNYTGGRVGATITLSTTKPTRTNYTFTGWFTAESGGTKYGTTTTISANTTIYAQWSGNVYTVTLNTQSATSAGSTAVYEKYGTGIYKETACTTQMTTSANAITKPSRSYTLTYNANGGTVSGTSTTASYTFGGYYTATGGGGDQLINANGNITTAFTTTKYSANATLYAKWTNNSISLATPTRTGYTFKGWFTAASGGTQITSATSITANQTIYAQWTPVNYTQTVQVRYENVDGTFTGYSNAINTNYAYGSTVSWSRAADATYQAASITSYIVTGAKTTQVTVYRQKYTLDLNGYLDGTSSGNLGVYGKADVYINGSRVSAGVTDFCQQYRAGTTYEIKNIVANNGYVYEGVHSGTLTGTLTKTTGVWLKFVKRDTLKFTNITRDGFTIEYYSADNITGARQAAVWTSSNGQDDIVWHGLDNNGGGKWSKRIYVSGHKYEYGEYIAHIYDNPAASMRIAGTVNVPFEERIYIYGVDSTGYKVRIYTNRSGVTKVEVPTWTTNNGQDDIEWITATSHGNGAYLATVKVSNHNYESGEYNSHVYLTINGSRVGVAALTANVTATAPPAHTCNINDRCNTVHTYPYAQYNYYWSSCGEWHNTCRHAICSVCGQINKNYGSYTTLAKCPNSTEGNVKPCPTPGTY